MIDFRLLVRGGTSSVAKRHHRDFTVSARRSTLFVGRTTTPRQPQDKVQTAVNNSYFGVVDVQKSSYHEISYVEHGEPSDVLRYRRCDDDRDDAAADADANSSSNNSSNNSNNNNNNLVRVDMLHAPWNPADVNTVQGRYPLNNSPSSSSSNALSWSSDDVNGMSKYFFKGNSDNDGGGSCHVIGSEGWGRLRRTAAISKSSNDDDSNSISSTSSSNGVDNDGQLATFSWPGLGTVRSTVYVPEDVLLRVPESLYDKTGPAGCTLFQLGGTALRMLQDFVDLDQGEVVIQNAGNSGVGLMVSQLATVIGGRNNHLISSSSSPSVVSLVRRGSRTRSEMEELTEYLTTVGRCALVVVEEDLHRMDKIEMKSFQTLLRDISPTGRLPRLALNAVGGSSAKSLLKLLDVGGTMVTYGGMSGKGIEVGTPQLIFKDLQLIGYWHSRWLMSNDRQSKQSMVDFLSDAVLNHDVVCPPVETFSLQDLQAALHWQSSQGSAIIRKKLVWDCSDRIPNE